MPLIRSQTDRVDGERLHGPLPESQVIETRYRLQPGDLAGPATTLVICQVALQGVERPRVAVHFAGISKPMMLTAQDRRALVQYTGSPLFSDWIDVSVELRVVEDKDGSHLCLVAPHATELNQNSQAATPTPRRAGLRDALVCRPDSGRRAGRGVCRGTMAGALGVFSPSVNRVRSIDFTI